MLDYFVRLNGEIIPKKERKKTSEGWPEAVIVLENKDINPSQLRAVSRRHVQEENGEEWIRIKQNK